MPAGYRSVAMVPGGPRAFRYRIRRLGPLVALAPAAVLALLAFALLHDSTSTGRGISGFVAAILAAPALMPAGVPLASGSGRLLLGAALSAIIWLAVGVASARRATRSPVAGWRDFWREFAWLAAGLWLGVLLTLGGIQLVVGGLL